MPNAFSICSETLPMPGTWLKGKMNSQRSVPVHFSSTPFASFRKHNKYRYNKCLYHFQSWKRQGNNNTWKFFFQFCTFYKQHQIIQELESVNLSIRTDFSFLLLHILKLAKRKTANITQSVQTIKRKYAALTFLTGKARTKRAISSSEAPISNWPFGFWRSEATFASMQLGARPPLAVNWVASKIRHRISRAASQKVKPKVRGLGRENKDTQFFTAVYIFDRESQFCVYGWLWKFGAIDFSLNSFQFILQSHSNEH